MLRFVGIPRGGCTQPKKFSITPLTTEKTKKDPFCAENFPKTQKETFCTKTR